MSQTKKPKFKIGQKLLYIGNVYEVSDVMESAVGVFYTLSGRCGQVMEHEVLSIKKAVVGNQFKSA